MDYILKIYLLFAAAIILLIVSLIIFLSESHMLNQKEKRLRSKKLNYYQIKDLKNKERNFFIQTISFLITAILVVTSATIGFSSLKLQEQNMNLIKQTSSTNWPNLEIDYKYPENWPYKIDAKMLVTPGYFPEIQLIAINSGKTNTGNIQIQGFENDEYIFANQVKDNINISSQMGTTIGIELKQSGCSIGNEEGCDISKLPKKDYNLTLTFYCEFCEKRYQNFTVPLYIYV